MAKPQKSVKVVVLGDIGRSPRMQYHALSLASNGLNVNIVGYVESTPLAEILENEAITITKLHPLPFNRGPKVLQYFVKALWQATSLFLTLLISGKCDFILCQNPPAIPSLPICRLYCLISRTKFIIDWHNYAHTIMALSLTEDHTLVRVSKFLEKYFGQSSDDNFCVTSAMKDDLLEEWDIKAKVLYDRPPKRFHPITLTEKHTFFLKISKTYPEFGCSGRERLNIPNEDGTSTAFTRTVGDSIELRPDRPGLLFSSTSWTPDEDFSVLLAALQAYETTYDLTKHKQKLPKLICVITGKGPLKEFYMEQIAKRNWSHVEVVTPWLEACDYPTMVASADLGVCLHTSSSGLDLPMKVVDMFGAGLPVCAYDFECLHELVQDNENGYVFSNSSELARQIVMWFEDFPKNSAQNQIAEEMRRKLEVFQEKRWEDNWNLRVKTYFE